MSLIWVGVALLAAGSVLMGYRWGYSDARQKVPAEHRPPWVSAWTMLAPGLLFAGSYLIGTNV